MNQRSTDQAPALVEAAAVNDYGWDETPWLEWKYLTGRHIDALDRDSTVVVVIALERQGEECCPAQNSKTTFRALMRGFKHKLRFFEDYTYAGWPGIGTAELGKQTLDTLAELSVEPLSGIYTGTLPSKEWHSPLWKVRCLFTFGWLHWLFEKFAARKDNPTW